MASLASDWCVTQADGIEYQVGRQGEGPDKTEDCPRPSCKGPRAASEDTRCKQWHCQAGEYLVPAVSPSLPVLGNAALTCLPGFEVFVLQICCKQPCCKQQGLAADVDMVCIAVTSVT